ncbi:hypothetical protein BKA66DRAFT_302971 [Pyrenochaeta sp. MPI-SDFR-AT-0127]|nr:hypothetical protein BKA66DRAFT_302971 [Pyrenochaeta sp. MPI-SDFR-AT-0127]
MLKQEVQNLEIEQKTLGKQCGKVSLLVAEKLCREFAHNFYTKLPRELREMVYMHVWDDAMLNLVFDDVSVYSATTAHPRMKPSAQPVASSSNSDKIKNMPWSIACAEDACSCFYWWELPAWAQHQFVGLEVAKEVVVAYYRAMRPVRITNQLGQLADFLYIDHFHLGVKPADHIRRLELNLHQSPIDYHKDYLSLLAGGEVLQVYEQNLKALLDVRIKRGFQLSFKIFWHGHGVTYNLALKQFHHIADKFKEAGASVTVLAWHTYLRKIYDASDYFTMPQTQWVTKWSGKIRQDIRNRRKMFRNAPLNSSTLWEDLDFLGAMADQYDFEEYTSIIPSETGGNFYQTLSPGALPSWDDFFGVAETTLDGDASDGNTNRSDDKTSTSTNQNLVRYAPVIGGERNADTDANIKAQSND